MSSAIELDRVAFGYPSEAPERALFANVSLAIDYGQITCLVGPSGCGKTTLLNLLAGFIIPTSGELRFSAGHSGRPVGYIFQNDALLPWRSIRANLGLPAELQGRPAASDDARIAEYMDAFNLEASVLRQFPEHLSGGMRQRIAIIQALLADPDILLLDEPFGALDFFTRLRLEAEFRSLIDTHGKAAVLVTHDIDEAIAVGDRVIVMGRARRGIVADIRIDLEEPARPGPEAVRGHRLFGRYFTAIWESLRDAV